MDENSSQQRINALEQLTAAKKMLGEGQVELASAQAKIKRAQELIDASADVLRKTWSDR